VTKNKVKINPLPYYNLSSSKDDFSKPSIKIFLTNSRPLLFKLLIPKIPIDKKLKIREKTNFLLF